MDAAGGNETACAEFGEVISKVGMWVDVERWKSTGDRRAGVVKADTYLE